MAIKDLQQRQAQVGRIRIGQQVPAKNGKLRPEKLDTFRMTSQSKPLIEAAATCYGGEVKPWTPENRAPEWEVVTDARTLPVLVPPRPVTQFYEMWSGAGCQRRCDGETEQISGEPCKCPLDQLERVDLAAKGQACKVTTRLNVMLPEIPGMGVWRLDSHGFYSALELPGTAEFLGAVTERGGYVRATLAIEERQVRRPGQGVRSFYVPALHVDATPLQLLEGQGVIAVGAAQPRQVEAGQPLAIEASPTGNGVGELVAEIRALALDTSDVAVVRNLWRQMTERHLEQVEVADGNGEPVTLEALLTARGTALKAHTNPVGDEAVEDVRARLVYAASEQPDDFDLERHVEATCGVPLDDATAEQLRAALDALQPAEVA